MNDWLPLLTPILLLGCLILLVVLLFRQRDQAYRLETDRLNQAHDLQVLGNQLLDDLDAQRDQNADSLFQANQSLMSTLSQMGQNQSALLESMQRQVLLSTRNQEERISALRLENERQLTEMRKAMDTRLSESLDRKLDESFAQVSRRLESVYRGLGEMQTLAAGVGDLKKVLTNVKTRGIWGEMQLSQLIRQTLAPGQFEENVAVVPGSAERVEFAIRLPGGEGSFVWLPVDSKFPQEDYLRLVDASQAGDAAGAEAARKALEHRMKTEAKKISEKYVSPPHTADFAILFLPVEGLYAEVLQIPSLVEVLQRDYRVTVAGPGTFSALLSALQMGFRTLAIQRRSGEVFRLLGTIKTDFARFSEILENTRRRLDQAGESIDSAVSRTRTIQRSLSGLEKFDPSDAADPSPLDIPSKWSTIESSVPENQFLRGE
ncbi:MAG: DNA recombination protein RmuC [Clostridia bacterium]|nr:DNA recombination protein RmuC [Clostridia bacterium]